jgi:hypothetical protein
VSKIEAERKSIPLFEVVEHIVGDLGKVVLQYEDLDPKESGLPQAAGADFSDERVRASFGNWEALLPVDEGTGLAWEGAWKKLSAAVRDGKLLVRGFRGGSEYSEEIKPEEFPELWDNRYSDYDFNVEDGVHCFLEFDGDRATIRAGHFLGASKVVWTGLCAVSGAEVLSLWLPSGETTSPPRSESKPLPPLQERILELARGLWRDGKLPPRIADRDNQILKKWPDGQTKPDPNTIQRAFKHWTPPDN